MRVVAWVFGIALLLYASVYFFKDEIRDWFFPNIVTLSTYGEAQIPMVEIKWTSEGTSDTLLIYSEGSQITDDFRAKGYNYFMLYYKGDLLTTYDQFKEVPASGHKYEFMLWQQQDSIQTDLRIIGPEAR